MNEWCVANEYFYWFEDKLRGDFGSHCKNVLPDYWVSISFKSVTFCKPQVPFDRIENCFT